MFWMTVLALAAATTQTNRGPAGDPSYACYQVHYLAHGAKLRIDRVVGTLIPRSLFAQWYTHEQMTGTWVFVSWRDRTGALTPPGDDARIVIAYNYYWDRAFTRGRLEIHRPPRPGRRGPLVLRGRFTNQFHELDVRLRLGRFLAFARGADALTLRLVGEDGRLLAEDRLDPALLARADAAVAAARPGWDRMVRARAVENDWSRCQARPVADTGL